ncbi:MAG: DNA mismatch repair protein MutS [Pseudomonadota bacterium]
MNANAEHPPKVAAKLTPMMAQYHRLKERAGDALLFYRMGDFYELFFSDAEKAAAALNITLTSRGHQQGEEVPMCGVPVHARDAYLAKLVKLGFNVAIGEQTEDAAEAKKRGAKSVVARDIVRIVTPGTLTEDALLEPGAPNHLVAIVQEGDRAAMAATDLSTGEVFVDCASTERLSDLLAPLAVKEMVLPAGVSLDEAPRARRTEGDPRSFSASSSLARIEDAYGTSEPEGLGLTDPLSQRALGGLLAYLELTQVAGRPALRPPQVGAARGVMAIDEATRRSLELTEGQGGGRQGSLLHAIDRTVSAGGGRLLRSWIAAPLVDHGTIRQRQDGVGFLLTDHGLREQIRSILRSVPDLARALGRIGLDRGAPSDLGAVRSALVMADALRAELSGAHPLPKVLSTPWQGQVDPALTRLRITLEKALAEELPTRKGEGGFIAPGYDSELDRARELQTGAKRIIADLETRYKEQAEIKTLRIKHDKALGYCVEVGKAAAETLIKFEAFTQRRTLTAAVRFTTEDLEALNQDILDAEATAKMREAALLTELVASVMAVREALLALADSTALLDGAAAFAELADEGDYVRPVIDQSSAFAVEAGRHPVVEAAQKRAGTPFVPNDCQLSEDGEAQLLLVTGPNMAGKSTYLRQNALIAVMAQAGSFVPAKKAHIGVIDRLFSRVGASDDLARGRSTFMVEMIETAAILHQATDKSFVVLDEVGRGTATYDGLSIAWATLEHLHGQSRCRGLFATHYHELTRLAEELPRLHAVAMAVREWRGKVVFLHEVKPGAADRSYGVAVARLAGLPDHVVERANQLLGLLEAQAPVGGLVADLPLFSSSPQADHHPAEDDAVRAHLATLDPDDLSPREAHQALVELKKLAGI